MLVVGLAGLAGWPAAAQPVRGLNTLPQRPLVMGYLNYLRSGQPTSQELTNLDYANVDIIAHAFADTQPDGTLVYPASPLQAYRPALLANAHARGKAVTLALFGDEEFSIIGSNAVLRAAYASNLLAGVQQLGYDGIDLDYEFPRNATQKTNLTLLLQAIHQRFKAASTNYIITFFVSPGFYIGQYEWSQLGAVSDFAFYGGYDWKNPANGPLTHPGQVQFISGGGSIEASVRGAVGYMISRGYPASQILVGMPFYSSSNQSWLTIRDSWATNRQALANAIDPAFAEVSLNGAWWTTPDAARRKCDGVLWPGRSVLTNGATVRGVGFWEIGHQDSRAPDLTRALGEWLATNTVRLTAPTQGAPSIVLGTAIPLAASAANPVGGLVRIDYHAGDALVARATNAPWTAVWTGAPRGTHRLTARAVYGDGLTATSLPVTVIVRSPFLATVMSRGSAWRYLDGAAAPANWAQTNFNDAGWSSGNARLGYGGDGEVTVLGYGPDPNNKHVTSWFRRWISVTNPALFTELVFHLSRDDGAAVHVNGRELFRSNLPGGPLTTATLASGTVGGADETNLFESVMSIPALGLVAGSNLVAIELHQAATNSSDAGFDLQILGAGTLEPRVYLAAPAASASVPLGGVVQAEAWAWPGAGQSVSRVEFWLDGERVAEAWTPPWRAAWLATRTGTQSLVARMVPGSGLPVDSPAQPLVVTPTLLVSTQLVASNAVWRYRDTGVNLGTSWTLPSFNDVAWASGPARLGYGGDGEATTVGYGPNAANKYVTTYFRRPFTVPPATALTNLVVRLARDDGAVVWLDGVELFRNNLPGGVVQFGTLASAAVSGADEQTFFTNSVSVPSLVSGAHQLAVEIHQNATDSSDLGFALELTGQGYRTELPVPEVVLEATLNGGWLTLSWPGLAAGYRLYVAPAAAAPPGNWLPVPITPSIMDGRFVVSLPVTEAARFYRLVKP